MSSVTIFQSDHFVLSTNFLFKFNVSLPLVTKLKKLFSFLAIKTGR